MQTFLKWMIIGEMVMLLDSVCRPDDILRVQRRAKSRLVSMWAAMMLCALMWPVFLPAIIRALSNRRGTND